MRGSIHQKHAFHLRDTTSVKRKKEFVDFSSYAPHGGAKYMGNIITQLDLRKRQKVDVTIIILREFH